MILEASRSFARAEEQGELFDFRYSKLPIWWFARHRIFSHCFQKISPVDFGVSRASSLRTDQLTRYLKDCLPQQKMPSCAILALSASSARRFKVDNLDFDVFFDFFRWTRFSSEYAILETPDRMLHQSRPYSPKRYLGDRYLLLANLGRLLGRGIGSVPIPNKIRQFTQIVVRALSNEGLEADSGEVCRILWGECLFASAAVAYAHRTLKSVKPRLLLVQSSSSGSRMAFQLSARELGIPIIEVQHGLIAQDTLVYFAGLADISNFAPLPDEILVFGEHFRSILLQSPLANRWQITVTGSPFYEHLSKSFSSQPLEKKTVLITTFPEAADFYRRLILSFSKIFDGQILIKPHPLEYDRAFKYYGTISTSQPNIKLLAPEVSLYDALSQCHFHASTGSFTHLEALGLGVKDIILSYSGFEDYVGFLRERGVPVVSNASDLMKVIHNYPNIDTARNFVREAGWSQNHPKSALERTVEAIEKHL